MGPAAEPAQPGAAQVPALRPEQEPDSHREQQGAAGGDHQVWRQATETDETQSKLE